MLSTWLDSVIYRTVVGQLSWQYLQPPMLDRCSLSHRSSSSVYSTILSCGSTSDSWHLSSGAMAARRVSVHIHYTRVNSRPLFTAHEREWTLKVCLQYMNWTVRNWTPSLNSCHLMRLFTPGLAKIGLHVHREIRPPTAETKAARKLRKCGG